MVINRSHVLPTLYCRLPFDGRLLTKLVPFNMYILLICNQIEFYSEQASATCRFATYQIYTRVCKTNNASCLYFLFVYLLFLFNYSFNIIN